MIKIILGGLLFLTIISTLAHCSTTNSYYGPSRGRSTYTNFRGGGPGSGK